MLLAQGSNLIEHINDHAWPGCTITVGKMKIVLMSSGIASMILIGIVLVAVFIPLARRRMAIPKGGANVIEVLVLFVRDMIAKPALHDHAYRFLPLLVTQFVFFLGMNLTGLVPLPALTGPTGYPVGFTPTAILTVTGAQAALVLVLILVFSFQRCAQKYQQHHPAVPGVAAALLSPFLFVKSLVPHVPGVTGIIMWPILAMLEIVSLFSKIIALMVRIFANMVAGHAMLAVFLSFIVATIGTIHLLYIGPLSVAASVMLSLLELLVAAIQAYIFTFLTAIFLGLYMEPAH